MIHPISLSFAAITELGLVDWLFLLCLSKDQTCVFARPSQGPVLAYTDPWPSVGLDLNLVVCKGARASAAVKIAELSTLNILYVKKNKIAFTRP